MHVAYRDEWVVILAFVGMFVALYVSACFLLLRRVFSRPDRVPELKFAGRLILGLAALGVVLAAYAMFVEPYSLEVTHVRIPIDGLLPAASPIRIAQISDLHCDAQERLEGKLPDAIKKEHPDIILFTGDACNSPEGFPVFYKCIKAIEGIAPLVTIKGDWDYDIVNSFGQAGLAPGGIRVFTIRGASLCIVGVPAGESAKDSLESAPRDMPIILLTHSPDSDVVFAHDAKGIDLICCGHTHGGQVAIPFYGPLISQSQTRREYAAGLHRILDTYIYTNRGIGMEGHFPRVRFCARPELTIFELVPSGKPRKTLIDHQSGDGQ